MKKLNVNEDACIGCGACIAIDSTHFDFNEDGLSEVISNENINTEEVKNAIASCPTNAISYVENAGTCHNEKCSCDNCDCGDDCNCNDACECGDECTCEGECKCGN